MNDNYKNFKNASMYPFLKENLSRFLANILFIYIFFILTAACCLADAAESVTATLYAGNYSITKDSSGYDVIIMDGFSDRVDTGNPMLPQKTFDVLLPINVDDSSLQLKTISSKTYVLDETYDIKPSPPWLPQTSNNKSIELVKNLSTYKANADYPESCVMLLPPSQMRKWKFVPVNFMPFQYNPVTGKLTLNENITIEISYSLVELPAAMAASFLEDTVLDNLVPNKFVNYIEVSNQYVLKKKAEQAPGATSGYIIITTNAIRAGSGKLSSFIAHKQNLGYRVQVVTEDDFDSLTGQAPNHRAEKIRQWLKDNYISKSIKYVLLIGNPSPYEMGEEDIPMKMCWPRLDAIDGIEVCPTDYFYADLTGNWDKNANQYYGEWADYTASGGVDLAADVYVGRIPVYDSNYTALDEILQKTMDYEISPSVGWRKSALLPMSFSDRSTDGAYLGEQMKNAYLSPNSYSCWRMYQHGTFESCNSIFCGEENLRGGRVVPNRWAGSDFGIVAWWGHGGPRGAYVGCGDGAFMLSDDAPNLDDAHPSHTYQCSCANGYAEDSNNLQYAILKNGGITTAASTWISWYYVGQKSFANSPSDAGMGYEYVKLLVQGLAAGDAIYGMKSTGVSHPSDSDEILMNFYDFCLDGDPSVSVNNPILLPAVTNSIGATAITACMAKLNGNITSTGGVNPTVHIYWGDNDGGTDPSSWDHDENLGIRPAGTFYKYISGLKPGRTYYYRCSASNSAGSSWADSTAIFATTRYKTGSTEIKVGNREALAFGHASATNNITLVTNLQ
jgi:hypothetical protein